MKIKAGWMTRLKDQKGFSLVEILGAVTLMSIITVTMMGYFITGLNKSSDDSRRIIAANLARLKAAEIREVLKSKTQFNSFSAGLVPGLSIFHTDAQLPAGYQDRQWLAADHINDTSYRFIVTMDTSGDSGTRKSELAALMGFSSPDAYLIQMSIMVHWEPAAVSQPRPSKSTTIDTYVVNSGV